jgi:hypothetical protein
MGHYRLESGALVQIQTEESGCSNQETLVPDGTPLTLIYTHPSYDTLAVHVLEEGFDTAKISALLALKGPQMRDTVIFKPIPFFGSIGSVGRIPTFKMRRRRQIIATGPGAFN